MISVHWLCYKKRHILIGFLVGCAQSFPQSTSTRETRSVLWLWYVCCCSVGYPFPTSNYECCARDWTSHKQHSQRRAANTQRSHLNFSHRCRTRNKLACTIRAWGRYWASKLLIWPELIEAFWVEYMEIWGNALAEWQARRQRQVRRARRPEQTSRCWQTKNPQPFGYFRFPKITN